MRILILGGDGMLGHQLFQHCASRGFEVKVTLREDVDSYSKFGLFSTKDAYGGVDLTRLDAVDDVISHFRPQAIVNAAGMIKQRPSGKAVVPNLELNALLPHRLATLTKKTDARLVLMSTDCVFSGKKGRYTEQDFADADDIYGRTKYLGEVQDEHCITLRTSMIGLELRRKVSLVEWFLAQHGQIEGFTKAIYTGFTTIEMSRIIVRILRQHSDLYGVWHVASSPISKYELLKKLAERLRRNDIEIKPTSRFQCDRSLVADRFNFRTGYEPPSWDVMLDELAEQIEQRVSNVN